jgi:hypothetical protein
MKHLLLICSFLFLSSGVICKARPLESKSLEDLFDIPLRSSARALSFAVAALNQSRFPTSTEAALNEIEKAIYRVRLDSARFQRHFGEDSWREIEGLVDQLYTSTEQMVISRRSLNQTVSDRILSDISRFRAELALPGRMILARK